jgi:hypothetical protein
VFLQSRASCLVEGFENASPGREPGPALRFCPYKCESVQSVVHSKLVRFSVLLETGHSSLVSRLSTHLRVFRGSIQTGPLSVSIRVIRGLNSSFPALDSSSSSSALDSGPSPLDASSFLATRYQLPFTAPQALTLAARRFFARFADRDGRKSRLKILKLSSKKS